MYRYLTSSFMERQPTPALSTVAPPPDGAHRRLCREQALSDGGDIGDFDEQAGKGFVGNQDVYRIVELMPLEREAPAAK
jgi:hypothetical protein